MKLNLDGVRKYTNPADYAAEAVKMNELLHSKGGKGNDFLGWLDLPMNALDEQTRVKAIAGDFRNRLDCVVVIGIGGSYLGAKAILTAMKPMIPSQDEGPEILFAGHQLSQVYLAQLLNHLKNKNWGIVVISKSGTTTEPALAFRILRTALGEQFGQREEANRIIAITDASKGALRTLADQENYPSFIIPDDVGGRFSVLTPVGLIPLAIAGIDTDALLQGAINMMELTGPNSHYDSNPAAQYAAARFGLYSEKKFVEVLSNFNPSLHDVSEWWKQLYGESEGKDNKGIFPASVDFTTDLHSMGQYLQEGLRSLFETCLLIGKSGKDLHIKAQESDLDELNYLEGKSLDYVNRQAAEGTLLAHQDGGVPIIRIEIDELNEFTLGQLIFFFEKACGISGYLLGVNPFDQPGVEAYKKNMFALLGKPGFEEDTKAILKRLGRD